MKFCIDFTETDQFVEPFLRELFKSGLELSDKYADIHVHLAHAITEAELETGKKFILLEKKDGGNILKRGIISHPAVIKYIKQYCYSSLEQINSPMVGGRYFTRWLTEEKSWTLPNRFLNDSDFEKIDLGWNFLHYDLMKSFIKVEPHYSNHRPIDVFFAGTTFYDKGDLAGGELLTAHRRNCIEKICAIKGINAVTTYGRKFSRDEYHKIMLNSKIVISPWGWGEACYRDYEAILCGSTLIKPQTDFVRSSCNIFERNYAYWSDPNFVNLESLIRSHLDFFSRDRDLRIQARNNLINESLRLPELVSRIFNIA